MYRNYKIVANTAAGRRRYMQYLVPQVIACDMIDRYDIWINTHNCADIEFFKKLAEEFPKINLVWQPDMLVDGINSINAFYKTCTDEDTIYFKLDDDLIWIEPEGIEKMVQFRVDHPDYFLVSPIVINNALSTYLLQMRGKLNLNRYYNSDAAHPTLWKDGEFAAQLHEWFIKNCLATGMWNTLHTEPQPVAMTRFSINAVLWFGRDLKAIDGLVPGDDEEFLSVKYPTSIGASSCWNGDVIASHFAFYPQRKELDSRGILEKYGKEIHLLYERDARLKAIDTKVQEILSLVNSNEATLMLNPSPYRSIPKPRGRQKKINSIKKRYHKFNNIVSTKILRKKAPRPIYISEPATKKTP